MATPRVLELHREFDRGLDSGEWTSVREFENRCRDLFRGLSGAEWEAFLDRVLSPIDGEGWYPPLEIKNGETVYHLQELEGRGGFGEVWRAKEIRPLEREVALKFVIGGARDRLARGEASQQSRSGHPNICPVFGQFPHGSRGVIVMQYLSGGSLRDRMKNGPIPPVEVADVVLKLARALDAAHGAEGTEAMLHLDVKPENVVFDQFGEPRLCDFGIARRTGGRGRVGTLPYMAPEVFRGKPHARGADTWSLGVVMYEMLTAERPFRLGIDPERWLTVVDGIVSPHDRVGAPAEMSRLCLEMLSDEPHRPRLADVAKRLAAVDHLSHDEDELVGVRRRFDRMLDARDRELELVVNRREHDQVSSKVQRLLIEGGALVLWGGAGMGKSHLASWLSVEAREWSPRPIVLYVDVERGARTLIDLLHLLEYQAGLQLRRPVKLTKFESMGVDPFDASLSGETREALKYLQEGWSLAEVASYLGTSTDHIRALVNRATQRLGDPVPQNGTGLVIPLPELSLDPHSPANPEREATSTDRIRARFRRARKGWQGTKASTEHAESNAGAAGPDVDLGSRYAGTSRGAPLSEAEGAGSIPALLRSLSLSLGQPLLVIIDGVDAIRHPSTARHILAQCLAPQRRVAVVMTSRYRDDLGQALMRDGEAVELGALEAASIDELVQAVSGFRLDERRLEVWAQRTRGNPESVVANAQNMRAFVHNLGAPPAKFEPDLGRVFAPAIQVWNSDPRTRLALPLLAVMQPAGQIPASVLRSCLWKGVPLETSADRLLDRLASLRDQIQFTGLEERMIGLRDADFAEWITTEYLTRGELREALGSVARGLATKEGVEEVSSDVRARFLSRWSRDRLTLGPASEMIRILIGRSDGQELGRVIRACKAQGLEPHELMYLKRLASKDAHRLRRDS